MFSDIFFIKDIGNTATPRLHCWLLLLKSQNNVIVGHPIITYSFDALKFRFIRKHTPLFSLLY